MKKSGYKCFLIDDWQVSPSEGLLTRGNEIVHLEPKAMEVLAYLAERPNEVVTREELERDVWHGALVGYDAVTNTIIKLRKALQDNARQPRFIATIPKMGYQLIASITYPDSDESAADMAPPVSNNAGNKSQRSFSSAYKIGMGLAVLLAILALGLLWFWPADSKNSVAPPSIVVLSFENISNEPQQDYLADGITEDIITNLSRLSNLLVIADSESNTDNSSQRQPQQIGRELKVNFVLKGSVRPLGEELRVNAQLIDTTTGIIKWAERYDRKIAEVFAVQDEVTHSIVNTLAVKMTRQEKHRLEKRATDNLKAYDLFQEGQRFSKLSTRESNEQANAMYRKAIEFDPGYGRAYGALAYTLGTDFLRGWTESPVETLDRALELAKKAVTLDDSIPQTYWALGYVYLMRQEFDAAEKAAAQSIAVAPSYADGYGLLALINNNLGHPKKAIDYVNKGMLLNPYYTWDYLYNLGRAHYALGNYDAAITALEKAEDRNENAMPVKQFLAVSYVKADRQEDAEWVSDQIQMLSPTATITSIEKSIPIANPELKRTFLDELRKAGLPE